MNMIDLAPELKPEQTPEPRPVARPEPAAAERDARKPEPSAAVPAAAPAASDPAATLPPQARPQPKADRSFVAVVGGTVVALLVSLAIGRSGWFTPGDRVGYDLGLIGGILMLTLLLYPLRKHVAAFRNLGKVKHWFAVHMVIGISGPVLVLTHSTFHMRSTNAAVALSCMLLVAGSGIVGRFFYTKVHRGLYGEKTNLKELQAEAGMESDNVRSRLHFVPAVEQRLRDFQAYAVARRRGLLDAIIHLPVLSLRKLRIRRACARELRAELQTVAQARGWDAAKTDRRIKAATGLVADYLESTQRVAEFSVYDRLLQLWHVAHVPLVYLLVLSAVAHVVAVHMY